MINENPWSVNSTDGTINIGTTSVAAHVEAINILVTRLKQITGELEEVVGQHILAIKIMAPNDWESIVRTQCGISRSRAYELMAIAEGIKTTEQVRHETNVRKIRHRQNQAIRSGTDGKELAAIDTQIIELNAVHRCELDGARTQLEEHEEAHRRQITRFEHALVQLNDARALGSERDQLRKALGEIVELLAEMRGLMTHSERNRTTITTKITRAEKIAISVLKPTKVAIVNLPVKQVA
jgi:hypothetical protein